MRLNQLSFVFRKPCKLKDFHSISSFLLNSPHGCHHFYLSSFFSLLSTLCPAVFSHLFFFFSLIYLFLPSRPQSPLYHLCCNSSAFFSLSSPYPLLPLLPPSLLSHLSSAETGELRNEMMRVLRVKSRRSSRRCKWFMS